MQYLKVWEDVAIYLLPSTIPCLVNGLVYFCARQWTISGHSSKQENGPGWLPLIVIAVPYLDIHNVSCACISYYLALIPTCIMVPATFEGSVAIIKKAQHDFPKMRGGSKAVLELFQKFITFGDATLP